MVYIKNLLKQNEHSIQCMVVQWASLQRNVYPELDLLFAIPNGVNKNVVSAMRFKAEGLKSGVPDLCLPVSRCGYYALYIELKSKGGKPSQNQLDWLVKLSNQRNCCVLANSAEKAIDFLKNYIKGHLHTTPETGYYTLL